MSKEWRLNSEAECLAKVKDLIKEGRKSDEITVLSPFPVYGLDKALRSGPSPLKYFTLLGAVCGFVLAFSFIIFTVLDWPLNTGGKPLISIPAFLIIAFELTILLGGICSFIGFLLLSRLPGKRALVAPRECGNQFVVRLRGEGR